MKEHNTVRFMRTQVTSIEISDLFSISHRQVLRSIRRITESDPDFLGGYFEESSYTSPQNKVLPMYVMGVDGFQILSSSPSMSRGKSAETKARLLNDFGSECFVVHQKTSRSEDLFFEMLREFAPDQHIKRQFPVNGKKVDFYLEQTGIFIEYDEEQHFSLSAQEKDSERWESIAEFVKQKTGARPWLLRVKKGREIEGLRKLVSIICIVATHDLIMGVDEEKRIVN